MTTERKDKILDFLKGLTFDSSLKIIAFLYGVYQFGQYTNKLTGSWEKVKTNTTFSAEQVIVVKAMIETIENKQTIGFNKIQDSLHYYQLDINELKKHLK